MIADSVLALGVGIPAVAVTARVGDEFAVDDRMVDVWAVGLVAVASLVLAVRRRWPLAVLGVVTSATTVYLLVGYPYGPVLLTMLVAVYTVARQRPLAVSARACGIALAVILTHVFIHPSALGWLGLIPGSAWVVVPFAIGTTVRTASESAEAARAESVREQLYDERLRIAQEVHDVVGHGLAAIQMQADVALHVDEPKAPRTRAALEAISRASSDAFEELRSTLYVIQRRGEASLAPSAPGVGHIEELCDRMRRAGVAVTLDVSRGAPNHMSPAVDVAAYRVVQEALTNVVRHGAFPAATVHVEVAERHVDITVTNPGHVSPSSDEGLGLSGMERRVTHLGGTFRAGATNDGYAVNARIPLRGDA